ncbi:MAG: DUF445 family protein [Gemmatimonadota bacterium]
MIASIDWTQALLTVAFGALAGGVTNRVAIWMLFHPYAAPRILGRRLHWFQGAVPKNQDRLARSIGRVVGSRLLTPADVSAELQDEGLRAAFETRLGELVTELVEGDQPALSDLLPDSVAEELRGLLLQLSEDLYEQLRGTLESPEFERQAGQLLTSLKDQLEGEAVADSLDPERWSDVRARADEWLAGLAASEALEDTVRHHLREAAGRVLRPGNTLEELIPSGLVAAVEHAINDYLPLAMERLGRLLEDPKARRRVERTVHELLDRFMRDLKFHQRVVAKLIITEDTVDRVLRTLETEGTDQLGDLLKETAVQAAMARGVNDAIVEFLRRPATSVLGRLDDPQVESALDAAANWIVGAARDPRARTLLLEQLEDVVWRVAERSWGELVAVVPAERLGPWMALALHSEPGRRIFRTLSESLVDRILDRPIGRLNRFLREDAAGRLADTVGPPAWEWIAEQVPQVAERVRVADRVEARIRAYPLRELEGLVRSVTERELELIVRLGYVLGGTIGTALVVVNLLIG